MAITINDNHNLVLIEHADHLRLHLLPGNRLGQRRRPRPHTLREGELAYEAIRQGASSVDLPQRSYDRAGAFAKHAGKPWPIPRLRWNGARGWAKTEKAKQT